MYEKLINLGSCIIDTIVEEIKNQYNTTTVKFLGGFENHVYEFTSDQTYIIRIGSSDHRSSSQIEAELSWIEYLVQDPFLSEHIIKPKRTIHDKLNFSIPVPGGYLNVVAFHKASGTLIDPKDPTQWNERLFKQLGTIMGKMHQLSKAFHPVDRNKFFDEEKFDIEHKLNHDSELLEVAKQEFEWIKSERESKDTWGLIHGDLHWKNYFYDNGNIKIFDFDDCCYSPFINDIAIAFFNPLVYFAPECTPDALKVRNNFIAKFLSAFYKGYALHSYLDKAEWQKIPHYLKIRDINFYTDILSKLDLSTVNDEFKYKLSLMHERIVKRIPLTTIIDFE